MPDYKQLIKKGKPAKNSLKKNRKETKRKGKFLPKLVLLLLVGVLILSIYLGLQHFLLRVPIFKIKEVSVLNAQGNILKNPEDIFHLDSEYNLFNFDMKKIVRDILARHPELAEVSIRKQFPDKVLIMVKARKPVAIIASSPEAFLVDQESFILPFKAVHGQLPKIIGIGARQMQLFTKSNSLRLARVLDLLKELQKAKVYPEYKVLKVDVREYSNIVFQLENNIEVKMGQSGFKRKALLLAKILAQLKETDTVPKYIDMRFDNPAVKP